MKTYLPQVEKRLIVRPNTTFGIINYDADNAYPQRVLELVRQSPTAKKCWGKRAKFLGGNGFEDPELGKVVVYERNGKSITLAQLLKAISVDKAIFPGFALHLNYNANYKIVSCRLVKFEDVRQGNTDSADYKGKYVIYKDWGRKTWRAIYSMKFDVIDPFNADPEIIKQQVINAGGWDKYKGQLFYLSPEVDDYPVCHFDAALEDIETEAGIKIFNNRQVTTGFMPSAMLFMKARREEADNEPVHDGMLNVIDNSGASQMEKNLATFQGAKEAQKIIVIEYEDETCKPELSQYQTQNNDKLFEVTSKNVEGNIIKAWEVPKELIQTSNSTGLNASGAEKREAIREFNDDTAPERNEISEVLYTIFQNWHQPLNPKSWNIREVTTEGSGPDVIKYADKVQAILESSKLTSENKINILVDVYGFKNDEAVRMVPDDEFIKEANKLPEAKTVKPTVETEAAA